ncbi:hypothetical protein PN836_015155 [Ningiella sp. W23]|uniref:hypothetical protein n=1 Tax=Ningiella sp. W23 TaxID=3023715 RepID=UPI0037568A1E
MNKSSTDLHIERAQAQRSAMFKKIALALSVLLIAVVLMTIFISNDTASDNADVGVEQTAPEDSAAVQFSAAQQADARDAFRKALDDFDQSIAPVLQDAALNRWSEGDVEAIDTLKNAALVKFANAQFVQALTQLLDAQTDAESLIGNWEQAFQAKLAQAQQLYDNNQIQQSRLALTQALEIKPGQNQSDALQAKLAAHDEVTQYISQYEVAKIENNIEKQVRLMQQILELDPSRVEWKPTLQAALQALNTKRLAFALNAAESALGNDDLNLAQTYLQQAKKIKPDAFGIKALSERLETRQAQQSLSAIRKEVAEHERSDRWAQALQSAQRGLKRFAQDSALQKSQSNARAILSAQASIQRFVARPARLSQANIRSAATASIQNNLSLLTQSKTLSQSAATLAALIDKYSQAIELTVRSDGQTHIDVVGVGKIGKVSEKTISLVPGRYTLEGRREGFRSKRVSLEVSASQSNSITLVCDEEI